MATIRLPIRPNRSPTIGEGPGNGAFFVFWSEENFGSGYQSGWRFRSGELTANIVDDQLGDLEAAVADRLRLAYGTGSPGAIARFLGFL